MSKNGTLIATTVFGLLLAAAPRIGHADGNDAKAAKDKTEQKVKCEGINACKGQGSCASARNDCAGKNGCKGQGWVLATAKECKAKGGTVLAAK